MTEYTIRFSADFGYAEEKIEAETPEQALEKGRAMQRQDLLFDRYDGVGDLLEIEVFEDDEELAGHSAAHWLSCDLRLRWAAREMLAALERLVSATSMGFVDRDEAEEGEAWEQAHAAIAKTKPRRAEP